MTAGPEEWRLIEGFPYEVSSLGRVRRIGGRPLKLKAKKQRYLFVCLSVKGVSIYRHVSRLVCVAFHGPPPSPEWHADHEDEDRQNNREGNLQWLSPQENRAKRRLAHGERNSNTKLTDEEVVLIRGSSEDNDVLAIRHDVTAGTIRRIKNGTRRRNLNSERAL